MKATNLVVLAFSEQIFFGRPIEVGVRYVNNDACYPAIIVIG